MANLKDKILSCLSATATKSYDEIKSNFEPKEQYLVDIHLGTLLDEGTVIMKLKGNSKLFLLSKYKKKTRSKPVKKRSIQDGLAATLPEAILSTEPDIFTTREVLRHLLSKGSDEVLVSEPFIDNIFVEIYEDEIRQLAKKGVRFVLLTRKISTDTWNIKGILKIFELYSMYGHSDKLEIYEHWIPLKMKGSSKQYIGLHAKLVLVNEQAYLGSANWTGHSLSNNFELGLVISDSTTLTKIRKLFFLVAAQSTRVDLKKIHQQLTCKTGWSNGRKASNSHRF